MNQRLLDQLHSYDKSITDLIQHSYDPVHHETIQFFAFSNEELKYIVSTYRKDSKLRINIESRIMQEILENTKDEISESILFSFETLETGSFTFKVQAFVEKSSEYIQKMQAFRSEDIQEILHESNDWIIAFQGREDESKNNYDDELSKEIRQWINENQANLKRVELLEAMLKLLKINTTMVSKRPSHGDYCYWNYFKGKDDKLYIFDWEFAKQSDWHFLDPLTNIFVFWMDLYKQEKIGALSTIFVRPKSDLEVVISNEFQRIMKLCQINRQDIFLFILFVYCRLYLRQETFSQELPLFEEIMHFLAFANKNVTKEH